MNDTKSSIKKCSHGVYSPDGSDKAYYCSVCRAQDPLPEGQSVKSVLTNPLPYGAKECPVCKSPKFRYTNEWDFSCSECGFDALS